MTLKTYTRLDLAENQLEAAIGLFVSGGDRFSVISLAGAAGVLLSRLLINAGRENFTDSALRHDLERGGEEVTREDFGRELNNILFINQLKHLDDGDDGYIEFDLEECALAAIFKALADYMKLVQKTKHFVLAFNAWVELTLDPRKYNVDFYSNVMPTTD